MLCTARRLIGYLGWEKAPPLRKAARLEGRSEGVLDWHVDVGVWRGGAALFLVGEDEIRRGEVASLSEGGDIQEGKEVSVW